MYVADSKSIQWVIFVLFWILKDFLMHLRRIFPYIFLNKGSDLKDKNLRYKKNANLIETRLKKFSPRPRGKSVVGKILFEYMVKTIKLLLNKFMLNNFLNNSSKNVLIYI